MELNERIIEKAGELFRKYGIKNVSMDEIASSMGISKRTLYENFKNK
ncbi:MAG: TetR/AcrR family transcriptional regulator [Proteiniphilum sp.]|nr:TetR/AcrR family transcriptional regulator [Proteiniphilum sp.]MEA5126561.1 TetR/AcrR family transcriptional regulator [Proteiniphilum sp.]